MVMYIGEVQGSPRTRVPHVVVLDSTGVSLDSLPPSPETTLQKTSTMKRSIQHTHLTK